MKFYQVAIKGNKPNGGLFETHAAAMRKMEYLNADERRFVREAMEQAGVLCAPIEYEVVEVTR